MSDRPGGYGRYTDDPNAIGCPRAASDMTPCVARDAQSAQADDGLCVGCGHHPARLLTDLVAEVTSREVPGEPVEPIERVGWADVAEQKPVVTAPEVDPIGDPMRPQPPYLCLTCGPLPQSERLDLYPSIPRHWVHTIYGDSGNPMDGPPDMEPCGPVVTNLANWTKQWGYRFVGTDISQDADEEHARKVVGLWPDKFVLVTRWMAETAPLDTP